MKNDSDTPEVKKRKYPTTLQILTSIYALLYLIFIIDNFLPSKDFNPYDLENIIVKLLFVLFLVGYYLSWKNEGVAGLIFIFWWIGMWCLALFVVEIDRGAGVVMGLPLFILGILFIVTWYRKSRESR
jgi:pilus assembly protein TadC